MGSKHFAEADLPAEASAQAGAIIKKNLPAVTNAAQSDVPDAEKLLEDVV